MFRRAIHVKGNQLIVCSETISGRSPVPNFNAVFKITKERDQISLTLPEFSKQYYQLDDKLSTKERISTLLDSLTRNESNKKTEMHEVTELFMDGQLSDSMFIFANNGSLFKKAEEPSYQNNVVLK